MQIPSKAIFISPEVSTHAAETHSALVLSQKSFSGHLDFEGFISTSQQLRTGSAPNPWETGWVVWGYKDNDHFYYLALKTNGWELGKRDPAYPGGQRFLATGETMAFPVGAWAHFTVQQDGPVIHVAVDGVDLVTFHDTERPYLAGKFGVYSEDARVLLGDVSGTMASDFSDSPAHLLWDGETIGDQWQVAYLGYGEGGSVSLLDLPHPGLQFAANGVPGAPGSALFGGAGWMVY